KTEAEIRLALEHRIKCFNVESGAELERLNRLAGEAGWRAPISFRVNPDVEIAGIDFNLGSKMMDPAPAIEAAEKVFALLDALAALGIAIRHFDVGGGLGVPYEPGESEADLAGYARGLLRLLEGRRELLIFEPGRYL